MIGEIALSIIIKFFYTEHILTTGAGCMVKIPYEQSNETSCTNYNKNHTCQLVFQKVIAGFTTHSFSSNYKKLTTYFYGYNGTLLHTVIVNKDLDIINSP